MSSKIQRILFTRHSLTDKFQQITKKFTILFFISFCFFNIIFFSQTLSSVLYFWISIQTRKLRNILFGICPLNLHKNIFQYIENLVVYLYITEFFFIPIPFSWSHSAFSARNASYSNTYTVTVWENYHFILTEKSDFHMGIKKILLKYLNMNCWKYI